MLPELHRPLPPASTASRIGGLSIVGGASLLGILLGSGLMIFVDAPSLFIVVAGTAGILLASFGARGCAQATRGVLSGGAYRCEDTVAFLLTAGFGALGTGTVGTLIGLVQMLQQMDDPTKIGPAMAVAMLTSFYAIGIATGAFALAVGAARRRSAQVAEATAAVGFGVGTVAGAASVGTAILCFFIMAAGVSVV